MSPTGDLGIPKLDNWLFRDTGCWLWPITGRSPLRSPRKYQRGGSPGAAAYKYQTHIDFLIAFRNIRKEQTSQSCPSNLVAPLTLRF
jgi:hypothetical protein